MRSTSVRWGGRRVPDHVSLWGLLLPIRKAFEQYVNLRPVRLLPGVHGPLAGRGPDAVDMLFLRENTEGEYSGTGGRVHTGTPLEVAGRGPRLHPRRRRPRRPLRVGRARERSGALISVTKSNASRYTYVLWDEVVDAGPRATFRTSRAAGARRRDGGAHGAAPRHRRRRRRLQPLRRHPHRPRRGPPGRPRPRGQRQPEPRTPPPLDVRARARLGARHRRERGSPTRSARSSRAR